MGKIKIDTPIGKERFENRDELNQMEMIGVQEFYHSELARGNLIYTENYLYPEHTAKIGDEEIMNLFMYRESLYITAINPETEEETFYKMT